MVIGVAPSPDGRRAAVLTNDDCVTLWDLESGSRLRTIEHVVSGGQPGRHAISWHPDGRRLLAMGVLLDTATGERVRPVDGAYKATFLSAERLVAGGGSGITLLSLDADAPRVKVALQRYTEAYATSDDGRRLVVGRPPGLAVVDLEAIERMLSLPAADLEAETVARTGVRVRDLDSPPEVVPRGRLARR